MNLNWMPPSSLLPPPSLPPLLHVCRPHRRNAKIASPRLLSLHCPVHCHRASTMIAVAAPSRSPSSCRLWCCCATPLAPDCAVRCRTLAAAVTMNCTATRSLTTALSRMAVRSRLAVRSRMVARSRKATRSPAAHTAMMSHNATRSRMVRRSRMATRSRMVTKTARPRGAAGFATVVSPSPACHHHADALAAAKLPRYRTCRHRAAALLVLDVSSPLCLPPLPCQRPRA